MKVTGMKHLQYEIWGFTLKKDHSITLEDNNNVQITEVLVIHALDRTG